MFSFFIFEDVLYVYVVGIEYVFPLIVEVRTIAEYMLDCFKAIYFPLLVTMFHYSNIRNNRHISVWLIW